MKRNLLTLAVFVLLAGLLAACAAPTEAPTATLAPTDAPAATATSAPTAASETAYPAPIESTQPAEDPMPAQSGDVIQYVLLPEQSEARYVVTEQLAGRDLPNDAVGVTNQITGEVYISPNGVIDAQRSKFVVQAGTLQTDQSRRDGFVRSNTLQTDQYPEIVFVPTALSGLADPLSATGAVSFQLVGNLTIRDVTKEVTWEVTGNVDGSIAKATAVTEFTFADFNLTQPRVPVVLSIKDNIRLEFDLTLERIGN